MRRRRRRSIFPRLILFGICVAAIVMSVKYITSILPKDLSLSSAEPPVRTSDNIHYYFDSLDAEKQAVYTQILDAFENLETDIRLSVEEEDLGTILLMIMNDHPEVFWVDSDYNYTSFSVGKTLILHPVYTCTAEEREKRKGEIEASTEQILAELARLDSDYEKIKRTFEYVIDSVDYELGVPDNQNIYSSLVNRRSVCAGYTRATQYLLQQSGIMALYVGGEIAGGGSHSWTIVRCGGEFTHVDTTFGDSSYTDRMTGETTKLPESLARDYAYLCCDDARLYRNHTARDIISVPACTATEYNYYIRKKLCFDSYSEQVADAMRAGVQAGERSWEGQFTNREAYEATLAQIEDGLYSGMILDQYTDMQSVEIHYSCDEDMYTIKLWY